MSDAETARAFVHEFHTQLSHWFAGTRARAEVWSYFEATCPKAMTLVYPSGRELDGQGFLHSIADAFDTSPGFLATIHDLEVVAQGMGHVVVAYVERQEAARRSADVNERSALAVVDTTGVAPVWRYIQETDRSTRR